MMEVTCISETSIYGKDRENESLIKNTLAKIGQETHFKWDYALPIALLWISLAPKVGLS